MTRSNKVFAVDIEHKNNLYIVEIYRRFSGSKFYADISPASRDRLKKLVQKWYDNLTIVFLLENGLLIGYDF